VATDPEDQMGRNSKITDQEWDQVEKRLLDGEKPADLAREFGVNRSAITRRLAQKNATTKTVANQLVKAESALRALPIAQQIATLNLADQLRSVSSHLASAANYGAMTAHRLSGIANSKAAMIDEDTVLLSESGTDTLKQISALAKISNDSAEIGLNLLKANKEVVDGLNKDEEAPLLPATITVERRNARLSQ
jgi:transposase-like protein